MLWYLFYKTSAIYWFRYYIYVNLFIQSNEIRMFKLWLISLQSATAMLWLLSYLCVAALFNGYFCPFVPFEYGPCKANVFPDPAFDPDLVSWVCLLWVCDFITKSKGGMSNRRICQINFYLFAITIRKRMFWTKWVTHWLPLILFSWPYLKTFDLCGIFNNFNFPSLIGSTCYSRAKCFSFTR